MVLKDVTENKLSLSDNIIVSTYMGKMGHDANGPFAPHMGILPLLDHLVFFNGPRVDFRGLYPYNSHFIL